MPHIEPVITKQDEHHVVLHDFCNWHALLSIKVVVSVRHYKSLQFLQHSTPLLPNNINYEYDYNHFHKASL